MENRSFDNLKSDLVSLGFSYVGEPSKIAPDTENVII